MKTYFTSSKIILIQLIPQLSNLRTEILELLELPDNELGIFSQPQCCSDTEVTGNGSFLKVRCPWRSPAFSALAYQIDKVHDTMQSEKLNHKRGQSMWMLRMTSNLEEKLNKVPTKLPSNCYHPDLISSLAPEGQLLLDMQPPVDLTSIMAKLIP